MSASERVSRIAAVRERPWQVQNYHMVPRGKGQYSTNAVAQGSSDGRKLIQPVSRNAA